MQSLSQLVNDVMNHIVLAEDSLMGARVTLSFEPLKAST